MEKFTSMLARLGLKGSSDDDGKRSAQSTPRLGRHRIHSEKSGEKAQKSFYGSLGSMEQCRVRPRERDRSWDSENVHTHHMLNQSWDLDRVPGGMDRSWEVERKRGMELLYQSAERQKEKERHERHRHRSKDRDRDRERGHRSRKKRERSREKNYDFNILPNPTSQHAQHDPNPKMTQERLERRLEEMNQQLLEEKAHSRRDKLTLARLQQEMARQKSQMPWRESLMKELERERMLRIDAEQRVKDETSQGDAYKSRLVALQEDFKKMEDMVRSLAHHKDKLDTLKTEKRSMTINYENSLQKYRTHISNLEHENRILLAEVKKIESQCANCQQCNKDLSYRVSLQTGPGQSEESEKSKVLLKRLKMLEEEKTALVLENENQRQQYEKCLDEIANQVVQALMGQKSLREECAKLQRRVMDLEHQNRHLNSMFQQRIKFASDSVLQQLAGKKLLQSQSASNSANRIQTNSSSTSLPTHSQATYVNGASALRDALTISPFSEVSLESLQSICSDYNEQGQGEELPGQPQLSSPPPWLKDKVLHSPTSSIASPATMESGRLSPSCDQKSQDASMMSNPSSRSVSPPEHASQRSGSTTGSGERSHNSPRSGDRSHSSPRSGQCRPKDGGGGGKLRMRHRSSGAKIETEFPVDNASPKMRHTGVIYHHKNHMLPPKISITKHHQGDAKERFTDPSALNNTSSVIKSNGINNPNFNSALTMITDTLQKISNTGAAELSEEVSPGKELLKLSDSFHERFTIRDRDGMPRIQNNLFDDSESDTDSQTSRPMSKDFSMASTVSLNELLERGLDDIQTPNDDHFSVDNYNIDDSEDEKDATASLPSIISVENLEGEVKGTGNDAMAEMDTDDVERKCVSSQTSPELEDSLCECQGPMEEEEEEEELLSPEQGLDNAHAQQEVLNNSKVVNNNFCPRLVPLQRPNSLDLKVTTKDFQRGCPQDKNCMEYSSDSDECTPTPTNAQRLSKSNPNIQACKVSSKSEKGASKGKALIAQPKTSSKDSIKKDEKPKSKGSVFSRFIKPKQKPPVKPKPTKPPKPEPAKSKSGENSKKSKKHDPDKDIAEKKKTNPRKKVDNSKVVVRSTSSSSPDSAMQQSFSSSSSGSDSALLEKPASGSRDDGYSSNSTASVAPADFQQESFDSAPSFTSPREEDGTRQRRGASGLGELPEDCTPPPSRPRSRASLHSTSSIELRRLVVSNQPDIVPKVHDYENGSIYSVNVQYKSPESGSDFDAGDYVDLHWLAARNNASSTQHNSQREPPEARVSPPVVNARSDCSGSTTPRHPYVNIRYNLSHHASFYEDLHLVRSMPILQGPFLSLKSCHSESCVVKIQNLQTYDLETLSHEFCTQNRDSHKFSMFSGKTLVKTLSVENLRLYATRRDCYHIMRELGQLSHESRPRDVIKLKPVKQQAKKSTSSPDKVATRKGKSPKHQSKTPLAPKVISPPPQSSFVGYALMGHRGFEPYLKPKSPPSVKPEPESSKPADVRQSAEGSEHGYQSTENLRPDAVGADDKSVHSEAEMYESPQQQQQQQQPAPETAASDMNWMLWSSDSEEDPYSPTNHASELWPNREGPSSELPEWQPAQKPKKTFVPSPLVTSITAKTNNNKHCRTETWLAGVESARNEPSKIPKPPRKQEKPANSEPARAPADDTPHSILLLESPSTLGPHESLTDIITDQEEDTSTKTTITTNTKQQTTVLPQRSPHIFESTLSPDLCMGAVAPFSDPDMDTWLNIDGLKVKEAGEAKAEANNDSDEDGGNENADKEFDEIARQMHDAKQTVAELRKSHPDLSDTDGTDTSGNRASVAREARNSSSTVEAEAGSQDGSVEGEASDVEHSGNISGCGELAAADKTLADVDVTDPVARADLLDRLVCDGFSDSGDSDSDPTADGDIGEAFVRKVKTKRSVPRGVLRHSVHARPTLDYTSFFHRYSDQEQQALDSFAFLEDLPSPTVRAAGDVSRGEKPVLDTSPGFSNSNGMSTASYIPPKPKRTGIKTVLTKTDGSSRQQPVANGHYGDVAMEIDDEPEPEPEVSDVPDESCHVENGDSDTERQFRHLLPQQHKTVLALKRESRRESLELNRMSGSSFESNGSTGGDQISISDSCCESFSSSEPNVNISLT